MHRAEHQRGRGAVAQQLVAEHARSIAGDRLVGEGLLGDEGIVSSQSSSCLPCGADDAGLHVVDMRVDEARRDQAARMVGTGRFDGSAP